MRSILLLLVAALSAPQAASSAGERITARCKSNFGTGEVIVEGSKEARDRLQAVVAAPAIDTDLHDRLWRPASTRVTAIPEWLALVFERVQDTDEISKAILADPRITAAGITNAFANTATSCFATNPPPVRIRITEYHNRLTNHYFMSSSPGENAAIDSGAAGSGWETTGEMFDAIAVGYCYASLPVFRFYTREANSHFFTVDAGECGFLRNNDPGWLFEGEAFGARMPTAGICPAGTTALYRLYNNRWMFNDSNHRFVKRTDLYQEMQASGWVGEGVAMCVENAP